MEEEQLARKFLEDTSVSILGNRKMNAYRDLIRQGPKFVTGDVVLHENVMRAVSPVFIGLALALHCCGYWGAVSHMDRRRNEGIVRNLDEFRCSRLISRWCPLRFPTFWVITRFELQQTEVFLELGE